MTQKIRFQFFITILAICIFSACVDDTDDGFPTCNDGIQNQGETGVDCGGSCTACDIVFTCNDGIQNGDETGIDCGGSCTSCAVTSCNEDVIGDCSALSTHPVMLYLSEYSCGGYCIMKLYLEDCPPTSTINGEPLTTEEYLNYFFLDDVDFNDSLSSINTMVHEAAHHITYSNINNYPEQYYHYSCDNGLIALRTTTFPSKDLVPTIEEDCRSFRFDTYIDSPNSNQSTQQSGIYGLQGEFTAYYHGVRTAYDLEPYYDFDSPGRVYSTMSAYYEFKFYMLHYLIYAETNEPDIYEEVIANENFIAAFKETNNLYGAMVQDYLDAGYPIAYSSTSEIHNVIAKLDTQEYVDMMNSL